ncbi:hypothetical protein [Arthrobacter methylotrophus]|uniref:hypothetical protein n=1 Tax=Arthrobacter methylotrophus TaxID=121291 RepID=UPI003CD08499
MNEKHGDDHSVNLGKLRAIAERPKAQQELTHAQLKALQVSLMFAIPPRSPRRRYARGRSLAKNRLQVYNEAIEQQRRACRNTGHVFSRKDLGMSSLWTLSRQSARC